MDFISLLKNYKFKVKYDQEYDKYWSDEILLSKIIKLDCHNSNLKNLPNLPSCKQLFCNENELTNLPNLPKCKILNCGNNQLTNLPNLPECKILYCGNNQLINLPELPKCKSLYCYNNQLYNLPNLPKCKILICYHNSLLFDNLNDFRKLWKFKNFYLELKYFRLMYKKMLMIKANKKRDLHLELKYSPDLKFYKKDKYFKHFHTQVNILKEVKKLI